MSTDAKDQAPTTSKRKRRLPRRIPSDLERMAKKVNEMRIANSDERLVIVNTICNVETNEALSKFMTIDGHVLLASWLNQALSQGHAALQIALLKLAARLPISGNMSTAIEAAVSELALKCPSNEIRELAKTALSQWQSDRPDPRHFSITIGDNERKVVFERDPNYYSSSGDDEPTAKRTRTNRKTLQWAPENRLEMVRVFHSPPEEKQTSASLSSSSSRSKAPQIAPQTSWSCPASLIIPENCAFREYASQSVEAKMQANRAAGLMEVVYFKNDHIPLNPSPPPSEPPSNITPYLADLRNLPPPVGGMKSGPPMPNEVLGLDSESALALDELISAGVDDLLESNEFGLEPTETQPFGFGRIRSPPPAARRDRPRSPPPVDITVDNFGLPLPPSPPRSDWHYPPQRLSYLPHPDRPPPFDSYGRPTGFREHPPYPYDQDHRRRSPPRPLPPYPPRPASYNEFNGPVPHGRYEDYRGYPDHRFPSRFAERPNEFRDRPPSPFRGEMYPHRTFDDRRQGRTCRFYQMPRGCTLGDSCTFVHENPAGNKGLPGPPPHRARPRPRAKGRGPVGSTNEAPRPIETPSVIEAEGTLDQFGRIRKGVPASSAAPQ